MVLGPTDIGKYWEDRMNHDLYRLMVGMSKAMFPNAKSAIDVGCYTSGLLVEMDWIPKRIASDIYLKLSENWALAEGVEFVGGDAFELEFGEKFDLVISNQTIEHLDDPTSFIRKLLKIGNGLIISTTFETPSGLIDGHIQDPIDMKKFLSWFPVEIDSWSICYHPSRKIKHIISVIKNSHPNYKS
jgi:2-polyprenyl-3-methyl-5-hydroxy-6-metoxy-1,4-benzoquinol methylase